MNRRRELVLQRISRIGSLTAAESAPQNRKFRGKPPGTLSIEAAIGTYYDKRRQQDTYTPASKEPKQREREQISGQMAEYMSAIEESQLANAREGLSHPVTAQQTGAQKLEKALENDPSAKYQLDRYRKHTDQDEQTVYDRLDANRCAGFLLYSYDKYGAHSVLGEHITPGSYGGRITSGDFITKA